MGIWSLSSHYSNIGPPFSFFYSELGVSDEDANLLSVSILREMPDMDL
jgi:hypothetical protein